MSQNQTIKTFQNWAKLQFHIFLNALMFYTRIPVPAWMKHDDDMLNKATVYFPVIGWIVAGISGLVFYGASRVFNPDISIILSIVASVLTTGAFHEDGFADVCDGFGGKNPRNYEGFTGGNVWCCGLNFDISVKILQP
jgi:cobalamin synthase